MCMRNVLGVLEDGGDRLWSTFEAAVDLADRERARLTLVKTWTPVQYFSWCGPFAVGGLYVPPETEPSVAAERLLARAAEFVPADIPVTTMLLSMETERDLRRLICGGAYDAVVADERFLRHARRLRRERGRDGVETRAVHATAHPQPEARPTPAVLSGAR